jgi:hypothetical protein
VSSPTASNRRRLNRPTTVIFVALKNFIANSFPKEDSHTNVSTTLVKLL